MSLYEFSVEKADGSNLHLSDLKGKVVLIVNVASACGFTPQYKGLQELHEKYQAQGLRILGFPCNQFGKQESGSNEEIQSFCETNFRISFPVLAKIDVNGDEAAPLYQWLKEQAPGLLGTKAIKWNFTKFLVSKDGHVLKRFAPTVKPEDLVQEIEKALQ